MNSKLADELDFIAITGRQLTYEQAAKIIEAAAALRADVGADQVVVPREPTQEMVQVGYERYRTDNLYNISVQARICGIYSVMLAAFEKSK